MRTATEQSPRRHSGRGLGYTHVWVAGPESEPLKTMEQILRQAGYDVSVTRKPNMSFVDDLGRYLSLTLRSGRVELLVLDGSSRPRTVLAVLDILRRADWSLPVVLVANLDADLRRQAEALGVDAVLRAPAHPRELKRVVQNLAPVIADTEAA